MRAYEILVKGIGKPVLSSSFNPGPPKEKEIISGLEEDNHETSKKTALLYMGVCCLVPKKSFKMDRMVFFLENVGGKQLATN